MFQAGDAVARVFSKRSPEQLARQELFWCVELTAMLAVELGGRVLGVGMVGGESHSSELARG